MGVTQWANLTWPACRDMAAANCVTASSNTAVVRTLSAVANKQHCIGWINWSYSGGTPTGRLKIEDSDNNLLFDIDVTAAGPGPIPVFQAGPIGKGLVITLGAGGSGVTGKLNVNTWVQ